MSELSKKVLAAVAENPTNDGRFRISNDWAVDLARSVDELEAERLEGLKLAHVMTEDTQTVGEAVAALVALVRAVRVQRDNANSSLGAVADALPDKDWQPGAMPHAQAVRNVVHERDELKAKLAEAEAESVRHARGSTYRNMRCEQEWIRSKVAERIAQRAVDAGATPATVDLGRDILDALKTSAGSGATQVDEKGTVVVPGKPVRPKDPQDASPVEAVRPGQPEPAGDSTPKPITLGGDGKWRCECGQSLGRMYYAEREVFTERELRLLTLATELVANVPDQDDLRCHELARAVGRVLGLAVEDGYYGFVDHSWLWTDPPDERLRQEALRGGAPAWMLPNILDVYVPGELPQVQLRVANSALPASYRKGEPRTDVRQDVVDGLLCAMSRRLL